MLSIIHFCGCYCSQSLICGCCLIRQPFIFFTLFISFKPSYKRTAAGRVTDQSVWWPGYRLDTLGMAVWLPAGERDAALDWIWDPTRIHLIHTGGSFPGNKVAGVWSSPLMSLYCWGYKWVELYHSMPSGNFIFSFTIQTLRNKYQLNKLLFLR